MAAWLLFAFSDWLVACGVRCDVLWAPRELLAATEEAAAWWLAVLVLEPAATDAPLRGVEGCEWWLLWWRLDWAPVDWRVLAEELDCDWLD